MPTPTSKGVFVKPRRAWNLDSAAGAVATLGAVVGQFNYVQLYNDSSPSADLALWGFELWQNVSTGFFFINSLFGIIPGATFLTHGNPLVAGGPTPPGSIYIITSAASFGTTLLDCNGPNQSITDIEETPFLVIPPGWSVIFTTFSNDAQLVAGAIWSKY